MVDNPERTGPEDPTKINVHQSWELDYWSQELGTSKEEIRRAVGKVGPSVKNVKDFLGLRQSPKS